MTQHHMSVSKQEAQFLKSILAAHLDDYVEKLVREDKDKPLEKMLKNRQVGLDLIRLICYHYIIFYPFH